MVCNFCGHLNVCTTDECSMFCERCGNQLVEFIDMNKEMEEILDEQKMGERRGRDTC